jgi:hypothetical protein
MSIWTQLDAYSVDQGFEPSWALDRRLVDHRPDLANARVAKLVKDVFGERYPSPVYGQAQKPPLGRAVEPETARDVGRVGDQQVDVEMKVRNRGEVLIVQAGNVVLVDGGELGLLHERRA